MPTTAPKLAPYGSWKSPITSDLIVAQSIALAEVRLDGGAIYWLEGRPQEQGRFVVVRAREDGEATDVTPPPFNARTRVHEYGGGATLVSGDLVVVSDFTTGRLNRVVADTISSQCGNESSKQWHMERQPEWRSQWRNMGALSGKKASDGQIMRRG